MASAYRDQHRLPNPYLEGETDSLVPPHSTFSQSSGVQPLPKGAMDTTRTPSPAHHPDASHPAKERLYTPPSSPSQRLLKAETPSQAQFATYPDNDFFPSPPAPLINDQFEEGWVPLPMQPWFWIPLVVILVLGAIGLEIALHFSKVNQGWSTRSDIGDGTNILHYVYTLPPVVLAAILVAMWAWTDIEIKKMQPYIDLVHGDSPPERSLLLDYTRTNNFIVWTNAATNKHYLVALASLMVLLSLTFQPLAAALLVVKDIWRQEPDVTLNNLGAIGLNQNAQFADLTSFVTGAGYASAWVLYNLSQPPFIKVPYTVAPFQLPRNLASNGTVVANTTALKSNPGCQRVDVQMTQRTDVPGWINSASFNGCSITWLVDKNSSDLFGTDIPACNPPLPPQFNPVIFWFFTYNPSPKSSATFCFPSFSLWEVNVNVDLATGNLTKVTELRPFSSSSNFSSLSANVTGAPLNGRAYNGIMFNLTNPTAFILARENATQLQLPAAVYQAAVQSPEGVSGSFDNNRYTDLSTQVYLVYLSLVAKTVYFLPSTEPLTMQLKTVKKRVLLSNIAVHLLAVALLLLGFFGTIVHLFHRADRRRLRLRLRLIPGTIASAVALGARTGMGDLLDGRHDPKDVSEALQNRKFRIDPQSMKIIMEGEEGYGYAASPEVSRRRSIFATLQGQRPIRMFSKPLSVPTL